MPEEYLDVVDENDKVIGRRTRRECLKLGLLHRAVSVFIFNSAGELYLQRRSDSAAWYPDTWTLSSTGHVSSGETYREAAVREVSEELGVNCNPKELFKFQTPKLRFKETIEWEYITVFIDSIGNQKIIHNDEVKDGKFVTIEDLVEMIKSHSQPLTQDAVMVFERYARLKNITGF